MKGFQNKMWPTYRLTDRQADKVIHRGGAFKKSIRAIYIIIIIHINI